MGLHQTATRYNESMNPPLVELLALTRDWSRLRALPYNASEAALPTYAALFNACFDHLDNASRPTRNMEWILERDEHQILHAETLYRSARLVDAHWKALGGKPRSYSKRISNAVGMVALQTEWDFSDCPPGPRAPWFFNAVKNHQSSHQDYITKMAVQHDWARDGLLRIYMRGLPSNYPWLEPFLASTTHAPSNAVLGILIAAQANLILSPSPWQDVIQKWYPEWTEQALRVLDIDSAVQGPIRRWSEIEDRENHIAAILGNLPEAPSFSDLPEVMV